MLSKEKLNAMKRLKKEFEECRNSSYLVNFGINVGLVNKNLFNWNVLLCGGIDSPYEGGLFTLNVKFPDNFPKGRPSIYFITPIYHINVSSIKHSVLFPMINDRWNESASMEEVLSQLFLIFYEKDPREPKSLEMYDECRNNPELYINKIKYFTKKYASFDDPTDNNNIDIWDFSYNK